MKKAILNSCFFFLLYILIDMPVFAATTISTSISTDGNISIGTSSPWARFSINPNGITGPSLVVGSSTATSLIVSNGGQVGIGTLVPDQILDISGALALNVGLNDWIASKSYPAIYRTTTGSNTTYPFNNAGNLIIQPRTSLTRDIVFANGNASSNFVRAVINTNGNFGIATTSPVARLSVAGAGNSTQYAVLVSDVASTTLFSIRESGSVGVGIAAPTSQFQVATSSTNATTSVEFGKSGQNKGSCIVLYDASGTAVYGYVIPGGNTITVSTNSCR